MRSSLVAAALVLACAASANATTVYVTYTGTVASGNDASALFSASTGSLAGQDFTATFAFDVTIAGTDPNSNLEDGFSPTSPSLGATVTILGTSQTVGGSAFGLISGTNNGINFAAQHHEARDVSNNGLDLQIQSDDPSKLSAHIVPPLSYIVGADTTFNTGEFDLDSDSLTLTPTTLGYSLTAPGAGTTPLPAALPMFGSALGALGLLGWRRKRKTAAVA